MSRENPRWQSGTASDDLIPLDALEVEPFSIASAMSAKCAQRGFDQDVLESLRSKLKELEPVCV
jgi:hypothetical protein